MTKDDIIKLARKAGFADGVAEIVGLEGFANFAKQVVANIDPKSFMSWQEGYEAGMETAAVICQNLPMQQDRDVRDECAAAIRARGTT